MQQMRFLNMNKIRTDILRRLTVIDLILIFGAAIAAIFCLFDIIRNFTYKYDKLQVNDLAILIIMLLLAVWILSRLWWQELRYEISQDKQAGETGRDSEANYLLLFESNPYPMWVYDAKTLNFLAVNEAAVNHYGYSREEFLAMTVVQISQPEEVPRLLEFVWKVELGLNQEGIWKQVKKDGTVIDAEITWYDLTFANKPARVILAKDITERKRSLEWLRQSEQKYRTLFEASTDAIFLLTSPGCVLDCNTPAGEMFGYTKEELIGLSVVDLVPEQVAAELPNFIRKNLTAGGIFVETFSKRKNGQIFPSEISTRLLDIMGVELVITYVRDITERKQAEQALRESEAQIRLIADAIPAYISYIDPEQRYRFVNKRYEQLCSIPATEIVGKHVREVKGEAVYQHIQGYLKAVLAGEKVTYEDVKISADGDRQDLQVAYIPHVGEAQEVLGFFVFIQDITQRKQAEAALQRANDELEIRVQERTTLVSEAITSLSLANAQLQQEIVERQEAEAALKESEVRLSAIAANIPGIVYRSVVHPNGDNSLPFVSAGLSEICGVAPEEAMAHPQLMLEMIHPDDRMQLEELRRASRNSLQPFHYEYRIVSRLGTVKWLRDSGRYSTDKDGNVFLDAVALDITERKRIEEALRDSEERFSKAFHANPVASTISSFPEGRFLDVNDSFLKLSGYHRDDVVGHTSSELLLWPRQSDVESMLQMVQQQQSVRDMEIQLRRRSGEKRLGLASFERIDISGQTCLLSMLHDITERQRVEAAMQQQHLREQLIGEIALRIRQSLQLDEILNTTVAEVRDFLKVERVAIYQSSGGFKGKFIVESVAPECESVLGAVVEDLCYNAEYFRKYQQGQVTAINDIHEVNLAPCYKEMLSGLQIRANLLVPIVFDCELWGLLCAHQCSEPRQWQPFEIDFLSSLATHLAIAIQQSFLFKQVNERTAQLEVANKELEAFSYSVSHDLRAPLRHIDGFSKILLEDCAEQLDDMGKDYLNRVLAATQRMGHLIDDLLNLSRVTSTELRRQQVDISTMSRAICDSLQQSQPNRQMEVVIPDGLKAYGDGRLLQIVFENLLSNAWKYTSLHQTARIEVGIWWHPAGYPVYFVRDDGAGFDMAYANKLFGPFQRLHKTSKFPGTGIGLATVQRIIHRHGGSVWAESAVEQGATFYFTLGIWE